MRNEIPEISLRRLPVYLNYLKSLPIGNPKNISSGAIAKALKLGEVLVRKDLAYTTAIGKPKTGYEVVALIRAIEEYLCFYSVSNAVIVGAGGIGMALMSYKGFSNYGINIVAAFDNDQDKIGTMIEDKPVYAIEDMSKRVMEYEVKLAVLCVPVEVAQSVADVLVDSGVKAILNFAPIQLRVPDGVKVRDMDVAANLALLAREL